MIEQISLLTVDLIGHISCLLLCTALFRRTCAKRQLVLAFLGTLAAGYLITVVPVIREFPIKAILLVMVFTVFCHACYEGKILTQCLCAVFSRQEICPIKSTVSKDICSIIKRPPISCMSA